MNEPERFFHEDDLIGIWSSEAFFYDAFEDTQLEFHPDGIGCHTYLRPYGRDIALFKWTLIKDRIKFVEYFRVNIEFSEETGREQYSTYRFEREYSERFFKAKGLTISNKEIDVISFYSPLFEGINSQSFGILSKSLDQSHKELAMKYEKEHR